MCLGEDDVDILHPFHIDLNKMQNKWHGYRIRNWLFGIKCSPISVEEKLNPWPTQIKKPLQKGIHFLMQSCESAYKEFRNKRDSIVSEKANKILLKYVSGWA